MKLEKIENTGLKIVIPNNYWDNVAKRINKVYDIHYSNKTYSRLAWVIDADSNRYGIEIWVDSENGDILGAEGNK